jgi:hypothetical protein
MACGGATGARAGARLGSRRSGAGAGRGEAAWNAKNCSGAVEDGRRGSPHGAAMATGGANGAVRRTEEGRKRRGGRE